ncbi:hypothetical protein OS493_038163 [Desmophyllum pertusum]|uniref:Uncharacterized protein n=1 Tax=Desmophyllum pertusum TaxID=174260 RepID=A0A9X0CHL1_9CNID|nr:hypothetical protein OS493_038163 [Desmophyllum pertusum]
MFKSAENVISTYYQNVVKERPRLLQEMNLQGKISHQEVTTPTVAVAKSKLYEMFRCRYMSMFNRLSDEQIEEGIKELDNELLKDVKDDDRISYNYVVLNLPAEMKQLCLRHLKTFLSRPARRCNLQTMRPVQKFTVKVLIQLPSSNPTAAQDKNKDSDGRLSNVGLWLTSGTGMERTTSTTWHESLEKWKRKWTKTFKHRPAEFCNHSSTTVSANKKINCFNEEKKYSRRYKLASQARRPWHSLTQELCNHSSTTVSANKKIKLCKSSTTVSANKR